MTTLQTPHENSLKGILCIFLAAFFWGTTFVAQSVGMEFIGPNTYLSSRSIVGGLILIPVAFYFSRRDRTPRKRSQLWIAGLACGAILFIASILQQVGLIYTTVAKSGFITSLYIILVPLILFMRGKKIKPHVVLSIILAVIGLYLLVFPSSGVAFALSLGDALTLGCSLMFAMHILVVDHYIKHVNAVAMACLQLWFCAFFSGAFAIGFEEQNLTMLQAALPSILYAGILSSGIAYTLQLVGQRHVEPSLASLIMSLEAVISVLAGWIVLQQSLSLPEFFGCVIMFGAILLAQKR